MTPAQRVPHDWFDGLIPANVEVGPAVYLESSFAFVRFASRRQPGLVMGEGSGAYSETSFVVGPEGRVEVGPYTCLAGPCLICNREIRIGAHCLISWGVVIADSAPAASREDHHDRMCAVADAPDRHLTPYEPVAPVVIEDAVWIGFGSVIMPGVTLGRGCIVGCKSVVTEDVPPGAIVGGNPLRVIRMVEPAGV